MKKNIQITAILMALAIFGLCALIAPVCADSEGTDTEEVVAGDEGNVSNESEAAEEEVEVDEESEAADAPAVSEATDAPADSEAADEDSETADTEPSPGFGIVAVMISMAVLFLLIRKNE